MTPLSPGTYWIIADPQTHEWCAIYSTRREMREARAVLGADAEMIKITVEVTR